MSKLKFSKRLFKKAEMQIQDEFVELTEVILPWFRENCGYHSLHDDHSMRFGSMTLEDIRGNICNDKKSKYSGAHCFLWSNESIKFKLKISMFDEIVENELIDKWIIDKLPKPETDFEQKVIEEFIKIDYNGMDYTQKYKRVYNLILNFPQHYMNQIIMLSTMLAEGSTNLAAALLTQKNYLNCGCNEKSLNFIRGYFIKIIANALLHFSDFLSRNNFMSIYDIICKNLLMQEFEIIENNAIVKKMAFEVLKENDYIKMIPAYLVEVLRYKMMALHILRVENNYWK